MSACPNCSRKATRSSSGLVYCKACGHLRSKPMEVGNLMLTSAIDRTRIEVIDLDSPDAIEWSGSVDDFDITQLSEEELDRLMDQGYVTVGGGAAPLMCVRFALAAGTCSCAAPDVVEYDDFAKCNLCGLHMLAVQS